MATMMELSVLVPCFNEEGNLPELVERTERVFDRCGIAGEIVLVNDGSVDGTGMQIDALAASHPRVVGVHHPTNRGIAAGWKSGLERSRGRYVCTIDADLQYQPEAIAQLYREIAFSKADLVQGWRSSLERQRYDYRYYLSRGLDRLLKFAFAMREHDVKSGFVIYKREMFEDILRDAPHYFYFQHMITVVAKARGYSLRQVETLFEERRVGHSFIGMFPMRMIGRTLVDIGKGVVETRLREPRDMSLAGVLGAEPPRPALEEGSRGRRRLHRALLPFHQPTVSQNAPYYLAELRRTQWLTADEIEQLQLRRLRRLVQYAIEHARYWREALGTAGIVPDEIHTLADLRRIPSLDKQALRENIYFDLLADNSGKRKLRKLVTCGSTGEPLPVFVDQLQRDMRWANAMRNVEWTGYRFGDPQARLWQAGAGVRVDALPERIDALLARRRLFPAFPVDAALLRRFAQHVRRHHPTLLDGDTEALALVAILLSAQGVPPLGARAILTAGHTLSAETRGLIGRQLGAPVFDRYQSGEFGAIAQECERSAGYHINAESYIVEVVRGGRPVPEGEVGDVLVTDLNNRCLPLLRYRLGDLAAATRRRCPCGRGLPLLERISGRPPSAVRGADGRHVPASFFARLFEDYEYAVRAYQVVQELPDRVDVRVVRKSRFTEATAAQIRNGLAAVLGPETTCRVEFVTAIPPDATGTVRPCVSIVAPALFISAERPSWDEAARREASS